MKGIFFLLLFNSLCHFCFGQSGKITGKVINTNTGQPLGGATLIIIEKSTVRVADLNGVFSFNKLGPGIYSIKCSYTGFEEKIIE